MGAVPAARWEIQAYDPARAASVADALGLSPAVAAILVRRGVSELGAAREFLAAGPSSGVALSGLEDSCGLIGRAVAAGRGIAVFGDYDVDGVCSTAMMVRALRGLGASPTWRLPSRAEGYGLSEDAVRELAAAGVELLVTVDCGVTAVAEVALARSLGMEVVVTDHHVPGASLPDCPVVHPGLEGTEEPGDALCAAGVVLHFARALGAPCLDLDLAGLATVCDMVPLSGGENRHLARAGLAALARTERPGLRALMRVADLEPDDLDARTASFRLGPRINAAGRLHRADAALELVLTEDPDRADEIARELDLLNRDRRETEQRILHEAEAQCAPQLAAGAIVVAGEGWHPGVVGIVASRLVERHGRPCVVIALDGEGGGRGSGRSVSAYDLHAGLGAAGEWLRGFGGHRMAAGLEIDAGAVEGFRAALAAHAGASLAPADLLPVERVDAVVGGGALTLELAEELERLGPFGAGNPAPTLLVPAARVEHVTAMGEERRHARFSLASGGARVRGVAFGTTQAALASEGGAARDIAVTLERDRWRGAVRGSVKLRSLAPTAPGRVDQLGARDFWAALEHELGCEPSAWWPAGAAAAALAAAGSRELRDRRDEGFTGVAGELLTSGEPVLLVVADVARRREALEERVAGLAADRTLPTISWADLGADPAAAAGFAHVLALDPPPVAEAVEPLTRGDGMSHLVWGEPERVFTLACWRFELDLRPGLTGLWRELAAAGTLREEALEQALCGDGAYPRGGACAGRLLCILDELGLARWDPAARLVEAVEGVRRPLDHSAANRAYAARLAAAERHLAPAAGRESATAAAASG